MAIMSDGWIKRQCTPPSGCIVDKAGEKIEFIRDETTGLLMSREYGHPLLGGLDQPMGGYYTTGWEVIDYTEDEIANIPMMIEPFEPKQIKEESVRMNAEEGYLKKVISYGTSSYGYDLRCANKFKIFTNVNSSLIDPKNFDPKSFVEHTGDYCIIPPNSFALGSSVERFSIPRNVLTICLGKSTYARCGIVVNVTPFEPEWEGHVTLEFSNTTSLPAKIYAHEGVAQVIFLRADEECETSYKDRDGKYMNQGDEPVSPRA